MTIREQDIKLMASERLIDAEDGGGQMSAVEVEDGVVNNLFPDISRLDRTYGRVNLRKAYAAVKTANRDMYYGAHAIITDPPIDPRVSVLMFTTNSYTDERREAQNRIESYVVQGSISDYTLLGDQLQGQRMVTLFTRVDAPLPEIGNVYLLSEETTSSGGETTVHGEQQYVRVTTVEHEVRTYEDDRGTFDRLWIRLEIGSSLRRTFPGLPAVERFTRDAADVKTKFRLTQVADASRYYGIVKLDEAISPGDLEIKAESMFGQLVPSATAESPVVDVPVGADRINLQQSGAPYSITASWTNNTVAFGRPITPGTINLGGRSDNGQGQILNNDGSTYADVDYAEGLITRDANTTGNVSITAAPATAITDTAHTDAEEIRLANRGYNYTRTLRPIPQPGTLFVDYMAQGRWYRMRDNGSGGLADDFGGAGQIDYATGSVIVTLGALPDTGSFIIYSWATPDNYEIRQQNQEIDPGHILLRVAAGNIVPGSLTITWEQGGGGDTVTATDDGDGNLTGAATGAVLYGFGEIRISPNLVPDSGAIFQIEYDQGFAVTETPALTKVGQSATFTVSDGPIRPGSFSAQYQIQEARHSGNTANTNTQNNVTITKKVSDDGNGGLRGADGSIDYSTGEVTIFTDYDYTIEYNGTAFRYDPYDSTPMPTVYNYQTGREAMLSSAITVSYQQDSVLPETLTESVDAEDASFNLTPLTRRYIVPGSVEFTWNGKRYIDREGIIYTDWNRQTGSALAVGTIDYATGEVELTEYDGGGTNQVNVHAMLLTPGAWFTSGFYFRTPGAPLRPASLFIRATTDDGTLITGTANFTGTITSDDMVGEIDYETGIVRVFFGQFKVDENLTPEEKQEDWYDPENVEDGLIFKPHRVVPYTARFNAVVYSMMPLDAGILGLDPVRLPIDGRVPIIRAGEVVVVHNTQEEEIGALTPGQTITLPRDELAGAWISDSEGTKLDADLYTVNRQAGTITIGSEADLSEYEGPYTAHHRVEDMALVNEAEINGQLRLVGAIPRAYEPADTWISSAMIFGDLASRARNVFSQASWTTVWSDQRIGNPTTAQYNNVLYPITVNNSNAVRERWAIIFTSSSSFNVVGETVGVITIGNTGQDCTPINPVTGEPYFIIYAAGWGGGWATNNVLRFNTDAAHSPIWIARTTISGTPTADDDSFKLQIRGDAD